MWGWGGDVFCRTSRIQSRGAMPVSEFSGAGKEVSFASLFYVITKNVGYNPADFLPHLVDWSFEVKALC